MSQQDKARYYSALKEAGWEPDRHYRNYTEDDLKAAYDKLVSAQQVPMPEPQPAAGELPVAGEQPLPERNPNFNPDAFAEAFASFGQDPDPEPEPIQPVATELALTERREEMAGERLNTTAEDEVIEVDELGREWLQKEVRKPAFPKPRGRRVLTQIEHGVERKTVADGQYIETFEVASERGPARTSEVKITMPSYQTGIYRDRRFPMFKVHVYNDVEGFDLFDVEAFYGGPELVPAECKRMYVSNDLCYDIRSVVQAITNEYRQHQLAGRA